MAVYSVGDLEDARAFIKRRLSAEQSMRNNMGREMSRSAEKLIHLSSKYKADPKHFRFSKTKALQRNVESVMSDLKTTLYDDTKLLSLAYGSHEGAIVEHINSARYGARLTERIEKYATNFQNEIEAFSAAGMYYGMSEKEILNAWEVFQKMPYSSQLIKEAIKEGGFNATNLFAGGVFGTGQRNAAYNGMALLLSDTVAESWMYFYGEDAKTSGAVGFYSSRGSSYPCALCDDMVGFHPIDEYKGRWHPNCCCIFTFI